jgi:hypothetical protein
MRSLRQCSAGLSAAGLLFLVFGTTDLLAQPAPSLRVTHTRTLHEDLTDESVPYRLGSVVLPLPNGEVLVGHAN